MEFYCQLAFKPLIFNGLSQCYFNKIMLLNIDYTVYKDKLKIRKTGTRLEIYDPMRRRYFVLQPEELVRQMVIQYLIIEKKYPLSKMRVEKGLTVNGLMKRCDILIFDKQLQPYLLVECKSAKIAVNQAVFDQIARYNLTFRVPYLLVTNGIATFCCKMNYDTEGYEFLEEIPVLA